MRHRISGFAWHNARDYRP